MGLPGGLQLVYSYGDDRDRCLSVKPISCKNNMRQGRPDRLTADDRRRFEELFLPHLDAAYNLARWITRRDQDARDVVQNAYVNAFKGFRGFSGGAKSRAWFLTIVRNAAYDWIKKHAPEEKLIPYEEEKHGDIISINDFNDELVSEERREQLKRALERLPLELREVIILYELECLTYKELATALGIPIGTVMSRLSRARRRLQEGAEYGT
jgi:RNA polymerase sigma factor (sigma-70 family)